MNRAVRKLKSAVTHVRRYTNYRRTKTPVFVLGCQRSGTTLVLDVVGRSPKAHSYHESDKSILDATDFRLISDQVLLKAIARTIVERIVPR